MGLTCELHTKILREAQPGSGSVDVRAEWRSMTKLQAFCADEIQVAGKDRQEGVPKEKRMAGTPVGQHPRVPSRRDTSGPL